MAAQKERGFKSLPWSWQLECGGGWAWGPARATAPPGCQEAAGMERGAQAPGRKRAGLLLFEDRGPLPQFLPRGEAEEASPGEFGGLRASEILLQALRGLGPTSGCSRGAESRQGQEQGCWKWGGPHTSRVPCPRGRPAPAPLPGSSVPTGLGTGPGGGVWDLLSGLWANAAGSKRRPRVAEGPGVVLLLPGGQGGQAPPRQSAWGVCRPEARREARQEHQP